MKSKRSKRPEGETEFELNIASVIDCFTVLITYLLVSASFISITAMDISIDVPGLASTEEKDPSVHISIELDGNTKNLKLILSGAEKTSLPLLAKNGSWDLASLEDLLIRLKTKYPDVKSALVAADDSAEYREVVKVVETTKRTLPQVTLGDLQG